MHGCRSGRSRRRACELPSLDGDALGDPLVAECSLKSLGIVVRRHAGDAVALRRVRRLLQDALAELGWRPRRQNVDDAQKVALGLAADNRPVRVNRAVG
eukprot:596308-Pleurochrysis_carterae.AAC.3